MTTGEARVVTPAMTDSGARILLYDIETAPLLGFAWTLFETNIIEVVEEDYILSVAYKWLGEKTIHCIALPDYPRYKTDQRDDSVLLMEFQKVMNKADFLVAHNGDSFDFKKLQYRFLRHGLGPPHPVKMIDTLKAARRVARFPSNKLDELGNILGIGRKLPHTGKHLWMACMRGDRAAWKKMRQYNKRDVELLEEVYLRLRPFMQNHPNISHLSRKPRSCPFCQSDRRRDTHRFYYTKTREAPVFQCLECNHYYKGESHRLESYEVGD